MTIDERTEVDEIIATMRQSRGAVPPVEWVLCKLERRYLPPPTSQGRGIDTRRGRPGRALDRDPKQLGDISHLYAAAARRSITALGRREAADKSKAAPGNEP